MTDDSAKTNISDEDKKAITDGANWLSQWITERYNQGVLAKDEYEGAIDRLKNVKVVVADNTFEGLIAALEKGEIHLKKDRIKATAKAYKDEYPELLLKNSELTEEQCAVAYLKEVLASSKSPLGLWANFVEEPTIVLNVDKIKERGENNYYFSLTSATVHELTHNLKLKEQEAAINYALYGRNISKEFKESQEKVIAPVIVPEIKYFETDKDVLPPSSELKTKMNPGIKLKEGEEYSPYLDKKEEVYARLMQLRYDFGLKPNETFTKEQIDEIERRANEARENFKNGEKTDKTDIDVYIVKRYRNDVLQNMLNFTAEEKTEIKSSLKVQEWQSKRLVAQQKNESEEKASTNKKEDKTVNVSVVNRNQGHEYA